jgi:hypothetical protein
MEEVVSDFIEAHGGINVKASDNGEAYETERTRLQCH